LRIIFAPCVTIKAYFPGTESRDTQSVCTEKERKRERKRGKTERKQCFFSFFVKEKELPSNKNYDEA
jgi:hypothetical protein